MMRRPQIIGYRKNGEPIWLIQGGAQDDGDAGTDNGGADSDAEESGADSGTDDAGAADGDDSGDSGDDSEDDEPLGPKGKKALDAMKTKLRAERQKRRDAESKLANAAQEDKDTEAQKKADAAAVTKANARILKSEVKAAAKGVLADPTDAFRYLDLADFDVDEDGQVDEDEIADAIEKLVTDKPYLAAQSGKRFKGSSDAGPRNADRKSQLTQADLDRMKPAEIEQARLDGRLDRLMGKSK
ncbi:MAG: hypothetical protein ACRDLM_12245 [Gaiellaceae bacterium]